MKIILAIFFIGLGFTMYCLCVAAKRADEEMGITEFEDSNQRNRN